MISQYSTQLFVDKLINNNERKQYIFSHIL